MLAPVATASPFAAFAANALDTNALAYSPLISVVVPAYNAEAFIAATLASVLSQTYQNLEVWVIDDGSSDRTAAIVEKLAQQNARINLLRQPNQGVAIARNAGIQSAKGEFVAPIDADDLWWPGALEKLMAEFQKAPATVGVVYAWSVDIDEQDRATGGFHASVIEGDVYKTLICHNFLGNASSTLIRKACLDQIGGYSTELRRCKAQGCEDWDLYLRLAECCEFGVVPEFLVGYRKLASSMSQDFSQMARSQQMMLETVQQKHPEISPYFYRLSRSSFYLYLAQQCAQGNRPRRTLFWLKRAITIDPITPLLRPGLYVLFIKSWVRHVGRKTQKWGPQKRKPQEEIFPSTKSTLKSTLPHLSKQCSVTSLQDISSEIHRLKIFLKVSVSSVLHRLLLSV